MTTKKKCPSCGTVHTVEMQHEWTKNGSRHELAFIQKIDSDNIDRAKLEGLVPVGPGDGQQLVVRGEWIDGGAAVHFTITREPVVVPVAQPTPPKPNPGAPIKRTRADMETRAAELGIEFLPKWNDLQLAKAIAEKEGGL